MNGQPRVAVLVRLPLLAEGLGDALRRVADVRAFEVHEGEAEGLLASLHPDAVVVDDAAAAEAALAFARNAGVPAICVHLREQAVDVARDGQWQRADDEPSPAAIRNLLARELFGRPRR